MPADQIVSDVKWAAPRFREAGLLKAILVRKGWPAAGLLSGAAAGAAAAGAAAAGAAAAAAAAAAARAATDAAAFPGVCAAAGAAPTAATARPRRGGGAGGADGLDASSASSKAAAEEARLFRGGGSGVGAADAEGGTSALHAGAGTPAPATALVSHDPCSKPSLAAVWRSCELSSSQLRRHAGTTPAAWRDAGEAATASASASRFCLTRRCEPPELMSVCARGGSVGKFLKSAGDIQRGWDYNIFAARPTPRFRPERETKYPEPGRHVRRHFAADEEPS
mgnify:CR=1 FL=1